MGGRRKITDLDPFPLFWNLELPEETTKKVTKELPNKNCICTAEPEIRDVNPGKKGKECYRWEGLVEEVRIKPGMKQLGGYGWWEW